MHIRRYFATFGALAIASTSVIFGTAGAALAKESDRCPQGYVCFWTGENFTGNMTVWENPSSHSCDAVGGQTARTVYNNDDQSWDFYWDASCSAYAYSLAPGESRSTPPVHSWR